MTDTHGESVDVDGLIELTADATAKVRVHRGVHALVGHIRRAVTADGMLLQEPFSVEALGRRVNTYETETATLARSFGAGCFWGPDGDGEPWVSALERLCDRPSDGNVAWLALAMYPATLCLYAGGVAATAHRRYRTLRALLLDPVISDVGRPIRVADTLHAAAIVDAPHARTLPGLDRRKTPMSDRVFEVLRPLVSLPLPDDARYERAFDEFEHLLGLVSVDGSDSGWGPAGRFAWKRSGEFDPGARLAADVAARGASADVLAAGLFGGSPERFTEVRTRYAASLRNSGIGW